MAASALPAKQSYEHSRQRVCACALCCPGCCYTHAAVPISRGLLCAVAHADARGWRARELVQSLGHPTRALVLDLDAHDGVREQVQ